MKKIKLNTNNISTSPLRTTYPYDFPISCPQQQARVHILEDLDALHTYSLDAIPKRTYIYSLAVLENREPPNLHKGGFNGEIPLILAVADLLITMDSLWFYYFEYPEMTARLAPITQKPVVRVTELHDKPIIIVFLEQLFAIEELLYPERSKFLSEISREEGQKLVYRAQQKTYQFFKAHSLKPCLVDAILEDYNKVLGEAVSKDFSKLTLEQQKLFKMKPFYQFYFLFQDKRSRLLNTYSIFYFKYIQSFYSFTALENSLDIRHTDFAFPKYFLKHKHYLTVIKPYLESNKALPEKPLLA